MPEPAVELSAEDVRLQEYADRCDAAFQELFDAAHAKEEVQFAAALSPEFRGMQDPGWSTAAESMEAIDEYIKLIKDLPPNRMRTRVALSLYSHLSEASGLYEVPKNMLRIASGEDYNLWPFQHLVERAIALFSFSVKSAKLTTLGCPPFRRRKRHRASGAVIAPNANKVMNDLLGHAAELKLDKFQSAILETFDPDLRNGYAHADYIVWDDGIRVFPDLA
jgi:hypothetical protein